MKETKKETKEKELTGNAIVVAIGCNQCPVNEEYRISSRDEADKVKKQIGKVIECPNCHGKWMLKRIQMRGVIIDAEQDAEEWRMLPLFVPILTSFDTATMNILDVPVSSIEDEEKKK